MRRTRPGRLAIAPQGVPYGTAGRRSTETSRISNHRSAILLYSLAALFLCVLAGGCSAGSLRGEAQEPSFEDRLSAPYNQTELKKSMTLDVLPKIQRLPGELAPHFMGAEVLSHNENVAASSGLSEDGHKIWFNMVAFHEFRLNVLRKYFFVVDDTAPGLRGKSGRGLRFDCEMVLGEEVLGKSYAHENAKRIALLRYALENLRNDISKVGPDVGAPGRKDKTLSVCGMLMNQTFEMILRKLDTSPALAMGLGDAGGAQFDHITFDEGKVRLVAEGDIFAVKIRFGAFSLTRQNTQ